jgi:ParB family chromosome partitioning protein
MATAAKEAPAPAGEYRVVAIATIEVEKGFNNRRSLGDIDELAASIRSLGLLEPLIVWEPNGRGKLRLIAGERRLAASKQVGLKQVPVIVRTLDDKARLEALLVENLHRKDLDPLEEADGYKRLVDLGLKQGEIAKKVGRSEAHISKRLALAGLSPLASKLLSAGTIPIDAAIGLAKHTSEHQDRAIKAVQGNYGKIENAAPYQLRNLGDRARDEAKKDARKKKRAELVKKLRAEGVTILSAQQSYHWGEPGQPWRLGAPVKDSYRRESRVDMTPKQHSEFPCHAAAVISPGSIYDTNEPKAVYLCTDPKAHMTKEEAAAYGRKKKDDAQDSYEEKRRRADAIRKEIQEAQESRLFAIREALRSADQQMLAVLALESFVMSANLEALAELLGLPAGKAAKEKSVADYCNASHANLVRAAAAAAICIGERAIAVAAESQAGGYYHARADFPRGIAVAEWFKQVGIVLTDVETKALEKATKK